MKLASVIVDIPTQALDTPYTYRVPEPVEGDFSIEVGCAVVVPLGFRQVIGFVIAVFECASDAIPGGLDAAKLKYVRRAVSSPYFDEDGAACAQWLSERYIAPLSACIRLFTPPGGVPRMVRSREGYWRLERLPCKSLPHDVVDIRPRHTNAGIQGASDRVPYARLCPEEAAMPGYLTAG